MKGFRGSIASFRRNDDGSASWFSVIPLLLVLIILGIGLDVTNAIQQRTHLQVTADAAAHAALVTRNRDAETEASAKAAALGIAALNMPAVENGAVLRVPNIEFGTWNSASRTFTPSAGSPWAVRVITEQREANDNPVATYLLRLAGFNSWDVRARTTMEAFHRDCHNNGFVAEGLIDIQSNNEFRDGFCIISKDHVEVNQNNLFENGVSVQMPNTGDLQMPASGFAMNDGLQEALGPGGYSIKEVDMLDDLIPALSAGGDLGYQEGEMPEILEGISGVQDAPRSAHGQTSITQADIDSWASDPSYDGKAIRLRCGGNNTVSVERETVIHDVVMVTSCKVSFGQGVVISDSLIATSNTGAQSVFGPSGIQIGDHDCTPGSGGSAQILTLGGAQFGAGLSFQSGQVIAKGDVQFPARDFSVAGASVLAGGNISGTSNMTMEFCGDGGDLFSEKYFRIVQ